MDTMTGDLDTTLCERVIEQNGTRDAAAYIDTLRPITERAKMRFGGVLLRGFAPLGAAKSRTFAASTVSSANGSTTVRRCARARCASPSWPSHDR